MRLLHFECDSITEQLKDALTTRPHWHLPVQDRAALGLVPTSKPRTEGVHVRHRKPDSACGGVAIGSTQQAVNLNDATGSNDVMSAQHVVDSKPASARDVIGSIQQMIDSMNKMPTYMTVKRKVWY